MKDDLYSKKQKKVQEIFLNKFKNMNETIKDVESPVQKYKKI